MSHKSESGRSKARLRSHGEEVTAAFPRSSPANTAVSTRATTFFAATLAALLLLAGGVIHGFLAPQAWGDVPYKGVLFGLNALASLLCALDIKWGTRIVGWFGGALVALASLGAYVASRTIGLPDLPAEPRAWLEPLGVASLVVETGFLLLFARELADDTHGFDPTNNPHDFDGDESDD